ncbi:MAG: putative Ig domain-containing protein [Armatimonadetes bacterium]|nr:putative Ig domain-containing protein [Armatimonadota bacterium]
MEFEIRTLKPGPEPKITGPKVFGVRPGHPVLFAVSATGEKPLSFAAEGLPPGLTLDAQAGRFSGTLSERGEYPITLSTKNACGESKRSFKFVVGDRIALTPPLGWNSWNCFAEDVDEAKIRAAATAMAESGLADHGWSTINIDDCWQVRHPDPGRDAEGNILTNDKFPDMKALAEFIHSLGLKAGIYSSPGPLTCAGFAGSYGYEERDAARYAEWGYDYLKYDWCSYTEIAKDKSLAEYKKPYEVMRAALDKVDRDIVYSLCQYGRADVWEWGGGVGGNCWRTTGDIVDTWESMSTIGFSQNGKERHAGPGHWNDPDMMVVGQVGWGPSLHPTRLTPDEQYTHITLWSLLAAPLLIGCDMTRLDDFTVSLLTNDEVLDINQDPLGRQARRMSADGDMEVWMKELEDRSQAIGLFNRGSSPAEVAAEFKGRRMVRDVWRQQNLGPFDDGYKTAVAPHGAELIRVSNPE